MDITTQKLATYLAALRAEAAHYRMHSHDKQLADVHAEIDRVETSLGIKQPPAAAPSVKRRVEKPSAAAQDPATDG